MLVCDDVEDLSLLSVTAGGTTGKFPVMWLIGVRDASFHACRVMGGATTPFIVAEDSEGQVAWDGARGHPDRIAFLPRGGLMAGRLPLVDEAGDGRIELQAEQLSLGHPYVMRDDPKAEGGKSIEVPRHGGRDQGTARIRFRLSRAGNYVVSVRAFAADSTEDSFYASIDRGEQSLCDVRRHGAWHWLPVHDREKGADTPTVYWLEPGEHTLTIRNRESGTRIDAVTLFAR